MAVIPSSRRWIFSWLLALGLQTSQAVPRNTTICLRSQTTGHNFTCANDEMLLPMKLIFGTSVPSSCDTTTSLSRPHQPDTTNQCCKRGFYDKTIEYCLPGQKDKISLNYYADFINNCTGGRNCFLSPPEITTQTGGYDYLILVYDCIEKPMVLHMKNGGNITGTEVYLYNDQNDGSADVVCLASTLEPNATVHIAIVANHVISARGLITFNDGNNFPSVDFKNTPNKECSAAIHNGTNCVNMSIVMTTDPSRTSKEFLWIKATASDSSVTVTCRRILIKVLAVTVPNQTSSQKIQRSSLRNTVTAPSPSTTDSIILHMKNSGQKTGREVYLYHDKNNGSISVHCIVFAMNCNATVNIEVVAQNTTSPTCMITFKDGEVMDCKKLNTTQHTNPVDMYINMTVDTSKPTKEFLLIKASASSNRNITAVCGFQTTKHHFVHCSTTTTTTTPALPLRHTTSRSANLEYTGSTYRASKGRTVTTTSRKEPTTAPQNTTGTENTTDKNVVKVIGISAGTLLLLVILITAVVYAKRRKKQTRRSEQEIVMRPKPPTRSLSSNNSERIARENSVYAANDDHMKENSLYGTQDGQMRENPLYGTNDEQSLPGTPTVSNSERDYVPMGGFQGAENGIPGGFQERPAWAKKGVWRNSWVTAAPTFMQDFSSSESAAVACLDDAVRSGEAPVDRAQVLQNENDREDELSALYAKVDKRRNHKD